MRKSTLSRYKYIAFLITSFHLCFFYSCTKNEKNDSHSDYTIYQNAIIYTGEVSQPTAEAMVVKDGVIKQLGTLQEIEIYKKGNPIIHDLTGKTILPGFVESHAHPTFAAILNSGDIVKFKREDTKDEIITILKDYIKNNPSAKSIIGSGYYLNSLGLKDGETPTAKDLDLISPKIPILLYDDSYHSAWANSEALRLANVTRHTLDPIPGISYFVRYPENNEPTGYMYETTVFKIADALPNNDPEVIFSNITSLLNDFSKFGFTSIFDADNYFSCAYDVLVTLQRDRKSVV